MEITDIRIRKTNTEGKMRAVVSLTLDNMIAVHDIKIIESKKGLFIAMPCRKTPSGVFKDIVHRSIPKQGNDAVVNPQKYNEMADNPKRTRKGTLTTRKAKRKKPLHTATVLRLLVRRIIIYYGLYVVS